MRYLAILLLAPWLLILCWAYWAYPKSLPRTSPTRLDAVALLLALIAAARGAVIGFDRVELPVVDGFGRASGAIWQQVLPALRLRRFHRRTAAGDAAAPFDWGRTRDRRCSAVPMNPCAEL